ncbi:MAG: ADP-ribosylglycohydrolase family protein, partial [Angelakisella sp.]
ARLEHATLRDKMAGAVIGRFAACLLGVPVEGWTIEGMEQMAECCKMPFPPTGYWKEVTSPNNVQYGKSKRQSYTESGMDSVSVDDDITYTLLDLLILETYGSDFTTADVGKAWLTYLPVACTAEHVALQNLKAGVPADKAGETNNPYVQWIGADIRADGWAFAAAGHPEKAAEYAWRDAFLSHRRNGIYGEMYFAAAQAAAFVAGSIREALELGLGEIPTDCLLANDLRWALSESGNIHNYKEARGAVDKRFAGMNAVHTNNNACLTIFALLLGNGDYTKTISEVVAMGLDNDCTAATAGSILGAFLGLQKIPAYWYQNFNNTVYTYMTGAEQFRLDDVVERFVALALKND